MEILKELKRKRYELENQEVLQIQKVWAEYFDGELPDDCSLNAGRESLEIIGPDRKSWGVCTIYYYTRWIRESEDKDRVERIEKLKASHSSGGGDTIDEFERMRLIGIVGTVLADHGDDIHARLNEIVSDYAELVKPIDRAIWDLEKAERERVEKKQNQEWTAFRNKVEMDGVAWAPDVSIDFEERWSGSINWRKKDLPSLNVRFNDEVHKIAWFRISKISESGKTCSVQLKQWRFKHQQVPGRDRWSEEEGTTSFWGPDYVDDAVLKFDRVKIEYVWNMLHQWKDKVTNNIDEDGNPFYLFPAQEEIDAELKKYDDHIAAREAKKKAEEEALRNQKPTKVKIS